MWEAARAAAVARAAAAAAAGAPFLPSPRAWASARSLPGLLPLVVVDFSFPCSEPGSGEQRAPALQGAGALGRVMVTWLGVMVTGPAAAAFLAGAFFAFLADGAPSAACVVPAASPPVPEGELPRVGE